MFLKKLNECQTKIPQGSSLSKDSLSVLKNLVTDSLLKKLQFLLVYVTVLINKRLFIKKESTMSSALQGNLPVGRLTLKIVHFVSLF